MANAAVTNEREMRVVGMSRSGNHAIINWILAQLDGRYCFLNCAEPKTNPFVSARELTKGRPYAVNYRGFHLAQEREGRLSRKDLLLHSYEDVFLGPLGDRDWNRRHDDWLGQSRERLDVLILRDPFNLFASRLHYGYYDSKHHWGERVLTPRETARVWKQHAREFAGDRKILRQRKVCISNNAWWRRRAYRHEVAEALGLKFDDAAFARVPKVGGGSSFEQTEHDGAAHRMDVLNRWKEYEDDEIYLSLFDAEIVELSRRIFGRVAVIEDIVAER